MLRRWTVRFGPELEDSTLACDIAPDRLTLHLDTITLGLERDPLRYSEAFGDEARRVIEIRDEVGEGFIFTAYVILYEDFTAELRWIETRPLPQEEEEDPPSEFR